MRLTKKISLLLAAVFLFMIISCCSATEKQVVSSGGDAKSIFKQLSKKEKIHSYDAMSSQALDEVVDLEEGIRVHYQYAYHVKGIIDTYNKETGLKHDKMYVVYAIENSHDNKAVQVDSKIAFNGDEEYERTVSSEFEIDVCRGKWFCSSKKNPPYKAEALKIPLEEVAVKKDQEIKLDIIMDYAFGKSKKDLVNQFFSDSGYLDESSTSITLSLPKEFFPAADGQATK